MSDVSAYVDIELEGITRPVGRLWARRHHGRESASFEFDRAWLADPVHHALGPALPPTAGAFHTQEGRAIFGALGDSAPDRWGRRLITRNEAHRARANASAPRAPREIDFLLGVTDIVRQGALRFRLEVDGPYVAPPDAEGHKDVPPLVDLAALLNAANALSLDPDSVEADQAVRLLHAPGSSLGGARPKASVRDQDGALAIAKFPDTADHIDVIRWERVMLTLAERAGISVPPARLQPVGDTVVLIVRRFDRRGGHRVPFLSAMSLLDAADGDQRSYVEIFDALRRIASDPRTSGAQLWRRLAFNILASNFDDHLRNHAIIYDGSAWSLSPAYDLNPTPAHLKSRELSTTISFDGNPAASLDLALEVASEFMLSERDARAIAVEVRDALKGWRKVAAECGIAKGEIADMATAFEHADASAVSGLA